MNDPSTSNCSPCDWRSMLLYALGDHSSVKVRIAELRLYEHQMSKDTFQRRLTMMERDLAARRRIVGVIFQSRPKRWWHEQSRNAAAH